MIRYYIDEGFEALDTESLEQAIQTLVGPGGELYFSCERVERAD